MTIDVGTGELDTDIPTTTELLTSMNTDHFNVTDSKISINTNLAELKGPKGDDGTDDKGWTGVTYSGTTGIVIIKEFPEIIKMFLKELHSFHSVEMIYKIIIPNISICEMTHP